jgi:cell fate regulator YaaT (PSP1 superfamily)
MPSHLIEVEFKGNRREFYLWESEEIPAPDAPVIVEVERGEDLGHVRSVGEMATKRNAGTPHGTGSNGPSRKARRLASKDDIRRHDDLRSQDEAARRKAMERVRANSLVMKISDAEWQWDRKKLTFYFTAERRVDFRTLVRELAASFRTRIELKQIGVRDEAKRLDGIGRCGRQYCSASWLPELRPVSLGVAKDQKLSLNPTQISGACGRLMCSLRYEHEYYVQARRRFPKEGKILKTTVGDEKVVSNDIFRERVVLRNAEGEARTIPLAQLLQETGVATEVVPHVEEHDDHHVETSMVEEQHEHHEHHAHDHSDHAEDASDTEDAEVAEDADKPEVESSPRAPQPTDAASGDRRPHRRRGRRGGRRNRGKRGGGPGDKPQGGSGPSSGGGPA